MSQSEAWTIRQKIIGVLLRQARQEAGKSLKECGQVLRLSSSVISAIEHGKRGISLPEIELLAYYLEVPLEQLLDGETGSARTPIEELPGAEILELRHRIIGALLRQARQAMDFSRAEMATQVGLPQSRLAQYERGQKPIPVVELEALATVLAVPLTHFLDEQVGSVGEQQRLERDWRQFGKLPSDVRAFVLEPANLSYLQLAMSLSAVPAHGLRDIAASLLEITF